MKVDAETESKSFDPLNKIISKELLLLRQIWRKREVAVLILLVSLTLLLSLTSEHFTSQANIRAITDTIASDMLIAIGITLVLITGGIDISVGSVLGMSTVVAANVMNAGGPIWLAVLFGILAGTFLGMINGFFISVIGINPLITTLATLVAVRGAAVAWTRGYLIGNIPPAFSFFGQGKIGPIGVPILIAIIFAIIFYVLLNYTSFFQQLFFIGGNEKAARLSGVRVSRVKFITYALSGTLAGCAGILALSRTMTGSSQMGTGAEFRAIPAAVIGGASLMGGEGNITGPMLAVLLLAVINDALILFGVSSYYQGLAQGLILLFAVSIDALLHRKRQ